MDAFALEDKNINAPKLATKNTKRQSSYKLILKPSLKWRHNSDEVKAPSWNFAVFHERSSYLFQENDTIRFRVTLEDEVPAGQQPNIVGVDAYVIVLDENDNPPHFLGVPYEAVAEEDTPVGSTILPGIRVVDPDLLGDIIDLTCVPQPQVSH